MNMARHKSQEDFKHYEVLKNNSHAVLEHELGSEHIGVTMLKD